MKKPTLLILLMAFIYVSGTRAQPIFNELWGNAGFTLALPKLYTLERIGLNQLDLMNISEGTFGLFLGFKANLFEIKKDFYFGPSVYYQYNMPGTQYIMFPEDFPTESLPGYTQEIQYKISDFSINGDFYYKIPARERDLYAGAGVGIHDVRFNTKFILEGYSRLPEFDENDEIDASETKVGFHLIGKVKIIQNLFLEGRFEFVSGLNQFKLVGTYKLWSKRRGIEEE